MLNEFLEYCTSNKLRAPGAKVLLAVSGGLDSVVLCHLFREAGIPFGVAHCNFGLRGRESDGDERFVRQLAERSHAPFFCQHFDVEKHSAEHGISIQESARLLRYDWFEEIRAALGFRFIITAHHLDDSIETFFLHLLRGTGIDGLKGIPASNQFVIRPLLFAERSALARYAKEKKLRWREDSSNAGDEYTRNIIRHKLIPVLRKIQPSLGKVMAGNMTRLGEAAGVVQFWINGILEKAVTKTGRNAWRISLKALPVPWQEFLLYHFLKDKGFDRWQANAMLQPAKQRAAGQLFYSPGFEALKDRDNVVVRRIAVNPVKPARITRRNGTLRLPGGNWQVTHRSAAGFTIPGNSAFAVLDADRLQFPLTVRRWQAGDSFRPLGMKGRKKISDFLVDRKISRFEKENIFVILSGTDVVSLLGFRIDERYKMTHRTRRLLILEPMT